MENRFSLSGNLINNFGKLNNCLLCDSHVFHADGGVVMNEREGLKTLEIKFP